jgi:site-specific recombinase XerC
MDHGAANLTAMRGVGAAGGPARPRQATTKVLQSVLRGIAGSSLKDVRDRALFALRIAGALRAGEIAALRIDQLKVDEQWVEVHLGGWRSVQSARRNVLIMHNDEHVQPVALLDAWLIRSGVQSGRVFRQVSPTRLSETSLTEHHVVRIIQARVLAAGYDDEVLLGIKNGRGSVSCRDRRHPNAAGELRP